MISAFQVRDLKAESDARRRKLYRWAIILSVIYILDGAFMSWALMEGGFAMLGYGQVILLPVFIPAFFAGLVVIGKYTHGFMRRSWTTRPLEKLFFFLFVAAVVAKLIVSLHARREVP